MKRSGGGYRSQRDKDGNDDDGRDGEASSLSELALSGLHQGTEKFTGELGEIMRGKTLWRRRLRNFCVGATCVAVFLAVAWLAGGLMFELWFFPDSGGGRHGGRPEPAPAGLSDGEAAAWRDLAAAIHNASDPAADPCEDPYQYFCGGWLAATEIPEGASGAGAFGDVAQRTYARVYEIATAGWPVIGDWYGACTDNGTRAAAGVFDVADLLALVEPIDSARRFADALARLRAAGVQAVFSVSVDTDDTDVARHVVNVGAPETTLPRGTLLANVTAEPVAAAQLAALERFAAALFAAAAADADLAMAVAGLSAADALRIERELAAAALDGAAARDVAATHNRYTTETIGEELAPHFDWGTFWHTLGQAAEVDAGVWGFETLDARLNVQDTGAVRAADALIRADSRAWHAVRAYLTYRVLVHFADAMPVHPYATLAARFAAEAGGVGADNAAPLWQQCLGSLNGALGPVLSHYYVSEYFPEDSKARATEVLHAVLDAYRTQIENVQWMDEATRAAALAKLDAVRPLVGYPDAWDGALPFGVFRDDYLRTVVARERTLTSLALARLLDEPARYVWLMNTYDVNAYYDPTENDIVFPAGILQRPFFSPLAPVAANYGGLGAVVGHEISHGFDDEGRHYDADGDLRDWWTPHSAAEFESRAQCVADLYSGFASPAVHGAHVNGELTLGENLADIGGIRAAHRAFGNAAEARPESAERVAALESIFGMDAERLFFHTWGRVWCSKRRPELAFEFLQRDPHSPPKWRINGPASQFERFARVFGCRAGVDAMAPADTCHVWA